MSHLMLKKILSSSGRGIVFAAHGVAREFRDPWLEQVHISYENFDEVVKCLTDLDFEFLSFRESVEALRVPRRRHWVHFTFDDGYLNNLETVYPYFKQRGIPFSVFVSTYNIQYEDYFPTFYLRYGQKLGKDVSPDYVRKVMYTSIAQFDQAMEQVKALFTPSELKEIKEYYNDRPMSVKQLQQLAADPLVHIGSHSHRHLIMHRGQEPAAMEREIGNSIQLLRDEWKVSQDPSFCYPNGDYCDASTEVCRKLKVPLAFLTQSGFVTSSTSPYRVPRFWMANRKRTQMICHLAVLGNAGLYLFGRKPPKAA